MTPILEGVALVREFSERRQRFSRAKFRALDDVSVALHPGESLGVVGESGSGKSTLARLLAGVDDATHGEIRLDGQVLPRARARSRESRRAVQLVFQDPHAALNPRRTVEQSLVLPRRALFGEPANLARERVMEALERVGLARELAPRYPHELSGGQAQRVGIARALLAEPRVVIFDEALASLDLARQDAIVELLVELKSSLGLSYLFISHDLLLVASFCDRALVLERGRAVEQGDARRVFEAPEAPYTRELVTAVPRWLRGRRSAKGP